MFWVIEYQNGEKVTEKDINFNNASKDSIKYFYFMDGNNVYGINVDNSSFFINDKTFDLKINASPVRFIEYKTVGYRVNSGVHKIISWSIGFEVVKSNEIEKYIMVISRDGIYVDASKTNLNSGKVDMKKVHLQ